MQDITCGQLKSELKRILTELEQSASEAAVHKKKFEFSINQIRDFINTFCELEDDKILTKEQIVSYNEIIQDFRELHKLFCQYQLHCWAQSSIENPSNAVATHIYTLFNRLKANTSILDLNAAESIDNESPQWLQLHLLDLKGIAASFAIYLKNTPTQDNVAKMIEERLASLNKFIDEYKDGSKPHSIHVFSPIPFVYQQWRIDLNDFEMIKEIGSGISSNVFYGKRISTGEEVAIKKLKFKKLNGSKLQTFQREISVLAATQHPCLLKFVGATETAPFCIITEWMACDSLYREIHKNKQLDATKRTIVAFDIARGMQYLHSKYIIHRDLKSLNVLLDKDGHAKIGDFGYSRLDKEGTNMTQNIGTPHWMAPELLDPSKSYNSKIDVYAYGIVLWELASGQQPYSNLEPAQIIAQVLVNDIRPPMPDSINPSMRELIQRCWDRNPDRRPTFDEIVKIFYTVPAMLAGCNEEEFMKYVHSVIGDEIKREIELEMKLKAAQKDEAALNKVIDSFDSGIPEDMVTRCWETLEKFPSASPTTIGRFAAFFLNTKLKNQAAKVLRMLPCGSCQAQTLANAIEIIPSGSIDYDNDICIAACKNGCADLCVVYCSNPKILKVAMEVVAESGAKDTLRAAVADKCVMYVNHQDKALMCAAIRCLISLGDARRISPPILKILFNSKIAQFVNNGLVAVSSMSKNGVACPPEVIDQIFAMTKNEDLAKDALVSVCIDLNAAQLVLSKIDASMDYSDVEFIARVALSSAKHKELFPAINNLLLKVKYDKAEFEIQNAIRLTKRYINQN